MSHRTTDSSALGTRQVESSPTRMGEAALVKFQLRDVVFFTLDPADDRSEQGRLDQMGMSLGLHGQEFRRFSHSPNTASGPTLGDAPDPLSALDGKSLYFKQARAIWRL